MASDGSLWLSVAGWLDDVSFAQLAACKRGLWTCPVFSGELAIRVTIIDLERCRRLVAVTEALLGLVAESADVQ